MHTVYGLYVCTHVRVYVRTYVSYFSWGDAGMGFIQHTYVPTQSRTRPLAAWASGYKIIFRGRFIILELMGYVFHLWDAMWYQQYHN